MNTTNLLEEINLPKSQILIRTGLEEKIEIVFTGYSYCPLCWEIIPAEIIRKGDLYYIEKYCSNDKEHFEYLHGKSWETCQFSTNIPKHWSYYKFDNNRVHCKENFINTNNMPINFLLLTKRCNCDCLICYRKVTFLKSYKDMDKEMIKRLLKGKKNKYFGLFGGEPTVREDLPEIIKSIRENHNVPILYTNGLRLADIKYLNELKENGLEYVVLSFDGFRAEVYERLRGLNRQVYETKLKALDNLRKLSMPTSIQMVVARGINEDQITDIVTYARKNSFIFELWFRPLWLLGHENLGGLTIENLITVGEIQSLVCQTLGLENSHFKSWDEIKKIFIKLSYRFPGILRFPVCQKGKIYLQRKGSQFTPLFKEQELDAIINMLAQKKYIDLLRLRYIRYLRHLLSRSSELPYIQKNIFQKNSIIRIGVDELRTGHYVIGNKIMPIAVSSISADGTQIAYL